MPRMKLWLSFTFCVITTSIVNSQPGANTASVRPFFELFDNYTTHYDENKTEVLFRCNNRQTEKVNKYTKFVPTY